MVDEAEKPLMRHCLLRFPQRTVPLPHGDTRVMTCATVLALKLTDYKNKNEIVIESLDLFHASPLCASKRFFFSKLFLVQQVKIGYKLFFSHKNLKLFEAYIYLYVFILIKIFIWELKSSLTVKQFIK